MSNHRMTPRQASLAARQRQTRVGRMTRHTVFTLKRPVSFQVRKSLVDYVDMELADMETAVFYQRIFILAKNCHLTPVESEEKLPVEVVVDQAPDGEPVESEPVKFVEDAVPILEINEDDSPTTTVTADTARIPAPTEEVPLKSAEQEKEVVTHMFRFSDDDEGEEESGEEEDLELDVQTPGQPKDFFAIFSERLQELHSQCKASAITSDPICGLYLHMGDYSLLMLESSEDMIGCFTKALADCCDNFWLMNRLFHIEDRVQELFTKDLLFRRIPAVFLNEKFPTSTPTDEYLMGKQHLIIKDKLLAICRLISDGQQMDPDVMSFRESVYDEELPKSKSRSSIQSDHLQIEVYRKHLPEIQRIELVLASTRFYYGLDEFARLYGKVPFAPDEDGLFWPIQNNYTPPHIFRRTPYDINLTFAEYAAVASQRKTHESLVGSLEVGDEEEEAPPKEETPPKTE
ncbi:uncharacterized protein LOC128259017 [Drosophila gunungcola]|uniref:Uncharacterized protein n=1 Tax=Drosophila gunungcola TaxID=103775 RepID=A0A9P9YMG3_9MUSC|nr:uncharacterized protein LOC128259017 [Drosophila gunungcola]KAI8039448.1 hypothetical protein M5D96_008172 [Drosophila gunungcola]